jgi:integrase
VLQLQMQTERVGMAGIPPTSPTSCTSLAGAVQRALRHKLATMTLDLYGHLFGDQLDEVAQALNAAALAADPAAGAFALHA